MARLFRIWAEIWQPKRGRGLGCLDGQVLGIWGGWQGWGEGFASGRNLGDEIVVCSYLPPPSQNESKASRFTVKCRSVESLDSKISHQNCSRIDSDQVSGNFRPFRIPVDAKG